MSGMDECSSERGRTSAQSCIVRHYFHADVPRKSPSSNLYHAISKPNTCATHTHVTVKIVPPDQHKLFLRTEGAVHHKLFNHPHPALPKMMDCFEECSTGYLVFPALDLDLHTQIRNTSHFSEQQSRVIFKQLVSAVEHCHRHRIVLRDLKLGKICFSDTARNQIVIADLSGAEVVPDDDPIMKNQKGSPAYVSPEVLSCMPYDGAAADMWGLGVILYVMLTGTYPFQDNRPMHLFQKIQRANQALTFPSHVGRSARNLVCCLLDRNPDNRPTAAQLLNDPWFNGPCDSIPSSPRAIRRKITSGDGDDDNCTDTPSLNDQVVPKAPDTAISNHSLAPKIVHALALDVIPVEPAVLSPEASPTSTCSFFDFSDLSEQPVLPKHSVTGDRFQQEVEVL